MYDSEQHVILQFHMSRIISTAFSFKRKRDGHDPTERLGLDGKSALQNQVPDYDLGRRRECLLDSVLFPI